MKLDAECGCGASINLDSGTSGPGAYPYVPEGKVVDTFKAWMADHQSCRQNPSRSGSSQSNVASVIASPQTALAPEQEVAPSEAGLGTGTERNGVLGTHVWQPPILPKADRQCGKCGCAESSEASAGPCRGSLPPGVDRG